MVNYQRYLNKLPIIPNVGAKILGLAEDSLDISFKALEQIIRVDPLLTARILKIANSALYSRQRQIKELQAAITLLGFKNIKSIVLLITASGFSAKLTQSPFVSRFWPHSILTAFLAKSIATRTGKSSLAEEAFTSGLLHDIGQIAFFQADVEKYLTLIDGIQMTKTRLETAEQQAFGTDHKELGAQALSSWNFPSLYVDTAREHNSPNIVSPYKSAIMVVSVADLLSEDLGFGAPTFQEQALYDYYLPYVELKEADIDYYRTGFIQDLKNDPLFSECQELFNIE